MAVVSNQGCNFYSVPRFNVKSQSQDPLKMNQKMGVIIIFLNGRYYSHTWFPSPQFGIILSFIAKSHETGVPNHRDSAFQWGLYKQFPATVADTSASKLDKLAQYCHTETTSELKTMLKEKKYWHRI